MIIAYHRPATLDEALALINRTEPETLPLGGGTVLSRPGPARYAVVDLQGLGLNKIERRDNQLVIGAAATLQDLYERADIPEALREAIRRETTYNLRQCASVAGALVSADGKSPFAVAMLALGAALVWAPEGRETPLSQYFEGGSQRQRGLILRVVIPVDAELRYEAVAKTPADVPIVCGAVGRLADGLQNVVLGGFGAAPVLVSSQSGSLSGIDFSSAIENAFNNSYSQYSNQISSNLDYLKTTSAILLRRLAGGAPGRAG